MNYIGCLPKWLTMYITRFCWVISNIVAKTEGSLPSLQGPATGPYSEEMNPDEHVFLFNSHLSRMCSCLTHLIHPITILWSVNLRSPYRAGWSRGNALDLCSGDARSNLGQDTRYPGCFLSFSQSLQANSGIVFRLCHNHFQIVFNLSSFIHHPTSGRCLVSVFKVSLNNPKKEMKLLVMWDYPSSC
jgi:hypothetical protein